MTMGALGMMYPQTRILIIAVYKNRVGSEQTREAPSPAPPSVLHGLS